MAHQNNSHSSPKRRGRLARGNTLKKHLGIDHVVVEESFSLRDPTADIRGDGCYVTATVNSKRYYGLLVDQSALKAASTLHFENEASGLTLNRRMRSLLESSSEESGQKRPASDTPANGPVNKQPRPIRQVQKFRYVEGNKQNGNDQGYRLLLATFADVESAGEDDAAKIVAIGKKCDEGGGYVGGYYYQYEPAPRMLETASSTLRANGVGMRFSIGFQSFVRETSLPPWFPLSNLQVDQQKVLSMLSMKRDNHGNILVENESSYADGASAVDRNLPAMESRKRFRVVVIGGGIAGLSCCKELLSECDKAGIPVEVLLLEARGRLGGRLVTDKETFICDEGKKPFPVDLGASWIHGIDLNPLAAVAKDAGAEFITSSEHVRMFQGGMREVDGTKDDRAGEVFDRLLDLAAEDCWKPYSSKKESAPNQYAVRWYASKLNDNSTVADDSRPVATDAPSHRRSDDVSVDVAVGRAVSRHRVSQFASLSADERQMLLWNLKNVEYALGANVSDLSMRFWDIDERHAFEGDHVLLRQGYSKVVEHMAKELSEDDRFEYKLNFPVGKLEYSCRTATLPCKDATTQMQLIELSDSCRITSEDSMETIKSDFVVSCVPLGVLKDAVFGTRNNNSIHFSPPLPFSKKDAIKSVGFGLLNKVILQFATPFWRVNGILNDDQTAFGNASFVNPHHYMFYDMGKILGSPSNQPAVLMSLISGREAVKCECMPEAEVIQEAVATLRVLFPDVHVPDPTAFKVTRWGKDRFSRGSYTFLPPGTTNEDFEVLQSPINGNGDSLLLEGSETMRLFFAGEHTTSLHPSMAHGALLSGVRAAKQVVSSMAVALEDDKTVDFLIPMSLFRSENRSTPLTCALCGKMGTTIREGTLLCFRKGPRRVLVHNNCAENSPEVEVFEGKWSNVLKAVNRSRQIECVECKRGGATIGCLHPNCFRCYHFSCGEDTGWRFDDDGKEFFCSLHRTSENTRTVRISLDFYKSSRNLRTVKCALCGHGEDGTRFGPMLAFAKGALSNTFHQKCVKYSTVCDVGEDSSSRMEHEFRNVFDVLSLAKTCDACSFSGATIICGHSGCSVAYHLECAQQATKWTLKRRFLCTKHRESSYSSPQTKTTPSTEGGIFQHTLFTALSEPSKDQPGNLDIGGDLTAVTGLSSRNDTRRSYNSESSDESIVLVQQKKEDDQTTKTVKLEKAEPAINTGYILTADCTGFGPTELYLARLYRASTTEQWNVEFYITRIEEGSNKAIVSVAAARSDPFDEVRDGDILTEVNGIPVGSEDLDTLDKVLLRLRQEVDAMIGVRRFV